MSTIVRNVRDIDASDRSALQHVVGMELREDQQLIIQVVEVARPNGEKQAADGLLPAWCNVYEGLTDEEIDRIDAAVRHRCALTRRIPELEGVDESE